MKDIGIIAFSQRGMALAEQVRARLPEGCRGEVCSDKSEARNWLTANFQQKDTFLFICAAGIAVRYIAPLIRSKDVDPAVVVMDEFGRYAVPILSGHLGGANQAAAELAAVTGSTVVLTTATDVNGSFAVDVWSKRAGCKIVNIGSIKLVSSAILRGEKVGLQSGFPVDGPLPGELTLDEAETGICVSLSEKPKPFPQTMNVVPRIVTLGAGCRKAASPEGFEKFILGVLAENRISIHAIEKIASIDLKKHEKCMLSFSEKYQIPFVTYTAEELNRAEGSFEGSDFVKSVTGVDNVCERSASLGSGGGTRILSKTSGGGFTCALAMRDWKCRF